MERSFIFTYVGPCVAILSSPEGPLLQNNICVFSFMRLVTFDFIVFS